MYQIVTSLVCATQRFVAYTELIFHATQLFVAYTELVFQILNLAVHLIAVPFALGGTFGHVVGNTLQLILCSFERACAFLPSFLTRHPSVSSLHEVVLNRHQLHSCSTQFLLCSLQIWHHACDQGFAHATCRPEFVVFGFQCSFQPVAFEYEVRSLEVFARLCCFVLAVAYFAVALACFALAVATRGLRCRRCGCGRLLDK